MGRVRKEKAACRAGERAVLEGIAALSDAELVAIILGPGGADEPLGVLASALLHEHDGIPGLARAGPGALSAGVGCAKGTRVAAAFELGRRAAHPPAQTWSFPDSIAVFAWAQPHLIDIVHEELWVLALDGAHGLRAARKVAMGGLHGVHASPCDPLRVALREGASAFILVHNHPSGDPKPSPQDVEFTIRIEEAAGLVGTPLLDHVIVARNGHHSLLEGRDVPAFHAHRGTGPFKALRKGAGSPVI